MKTAVLVGSLLGALSLQIPVLDLTSPPSEPFDTSGHSGPVAQLPLRLTLMGISDQPYVIGDDYEYEVEVMNVSEALIAVAWSDAPVGTSQVKALVGIWMSSAGGPDQILDGALAYGDPEVPSSVRTLRPNDVVRIRSKGRWRLPRATNLAQELSLTNGRYQLRARLSIDDGSTSGRTELSPPQWVNLVLRP